MTTEHRKYLRAILLAHKTFSTPVLNRKGTFDTKKPSSVDPKNMVMSIKNWEDRFLVAALMSATNTSDRDLEAARLLRANTEALVPSQLPKSKTRRYLKNIVKEQRIRLSFGPPTPSNTFGNGFTITEPCFPSLLVATVILYLGNSKRWNELRMKTSKHTDRFPPMTYRATIGIALMMNKTCVGVVERRTLPFIPYLCALATRAGVRVTAPSHLSDPDTWRVSLTGRPFIHPNFVFDNIRNLQSPLEALAHEITLITISVSGIKYLQDLSVEEACELTASMFFAGPQTFDLNKIRDRPWNDEVKPILCFGLADALDNMKY